jgi:hypothetical protein
LALIIIHSLQWPNYAYRDQVRERQRLTEGASRSLNAVFEREKVAREKAAREEKAKRNLAWSGKAAQKDIRELRRDKRVKKRDWVKKQAALVKNEDGTKSKKPGAAASNGDVNSDDASSVSLEDKPSQPGDSSEENDWAEYAKEKKQAKKAKAMRASTFAGL